jgi:molybdopterin biosynthesis enzyme
MQAEVIAIGDELVTGQRLDTNSRWLSAELAVLGIPVEFHTTAADTLEDDVEPFLLRCELVVRTPRGRRLTARGEEHLGTPPQAAPQGRLF